MIDTKILKQLREETDLSFSEISKALKEADGDVAKAKKILSEKGAQFAQKKADRELKAGAIFSYIHHNKRIGTMVELLCETDFVARNDQFLALGDQLAQQIASVDIEDRDALLKSEFIRDPSKTVDQLIKDMIFKIGENITMGRFEKYSL
ncbi:MAG: Elongation factor Ts [Microgenomates bacterium OLB22]|nr:MAG: Elongation factor Ts [Microgenomates bacterium OLB22]